MFALERGWRCEVTLLDDGMGRALLASARRLARAAHLGDRCGARRRRAVGRPRAYRARFRACARCRRVTRGDDGVTIADRLLRAQVAPRAVRHRLAAARPAAGGRRAAPTARRTRYAVSERGTRIVHSAGARRARSILRPGRQDRAARQARPPLAHAAARRARLQRRDRATRCTSTGRSSSAAGATRALLRRLLRHAVRSDVRLRPGVRQLPRLLSRHRHRRRRPRRLRSGRARHRGRAGALHAPGRRHRASAALDARLRQHRDGTGRCAGRAGSSWPSSSPGRAQERIPLSSFHFGSGYTSRGKRRYVFTWNRDKFPTPREATRRVPGGRVSSSSPT